MADHKVRTISFTVALPGWRAVFLTRDDTVWVTPVVGWFLQECDGNTFVVAGIRDGYECEPISSMNNHFEFRRLVALGESVPSLADFKEMYSAP